MPCEGASPSPVDIIRKSLDALLSGILHKELDINLTSLLKKMKCFIPDR